MILVTAGKTSQLIDIFVQDSSKTDGSGLSGLVYNSSGLACYYKRQGSSSWTAVTLATMTQGTWASGGFVEGDATHAKGVYEFGIPDAAIASAAGIYWVDFSFYGATNMAPVVMRIGITQVDLQATGGRVPITSNRQKNAALTAFEFAMVLSSDHLSPATGKTVSGTVSIDGAAFGALTNSVAEVSNGIYKVNLAAADVNGNVCTLRFTATGCDDRMITLITQP